MNSIRKFFARVIALGGVLILLVAAWIFVCAYVEVPIDGPRQFTLKQGSSLRSVANQLHVAGVLDSPRQFELLARLMGQASHVKAGNYEIKGSVTRLALLRKITSNDYTQDQVKVIEGWTLARLRSELAAHPALKHETRDMTEAQLVARLGIPYASAEGLFFPDTYFFANGSSDLALLERAYHAMQTQLDSVWAARAQGLPITTPYEALILASIIEKETGQADERALVAAVFTNRLRKGMMLQTDPTVIYGMGPEFDGNLRKRDLRTDGLYNTYTRVGLPPTPIALPGLGSLSAAVNPAPSNALYFVARNDGTSQFSDTLARHERAVTKYQRNGGR